MRTSSIGALWRRLRGEGTTTPPARPLGTAAHRRREESPRRLSRPRGEAEDVPGVVKRQPDREHAGGKYQGVTPEDRRIIEAALPYTMTSVPRLQAVIDAVRYTVVREIPGSFAECGVWRGGSVLAMIMTLQELGIDDRDIYLYDTFEGMNEPTSRDTSPYAPDALETWEEAHRDGIRPYWQLFDPAIFNEGEVRETLLGTAYPERRLKLVRGTVEETLPATSPDGLALLRLDTDWYESTLHELRHLYPLLADGGVLIVDDYGFWEGARDAVDEYFDDAADPLLLGRIDFTGRIAVKH